jgi:N-terminal domain of toast_rack, DUF2154
VKIIKYLPLVLLVIVLVGCSLTVKVPTVNTDDTETYEISQPVPDNIQGAGIDLEMGGGRLNISGGSSQMVEGTVVYNVSDWKPTLSVTDNEVLISQNHTSNVGIPNGNIKNDWTLKLGSTPMSLRISAGAYAGVLDLSGVALTNLEINDGASQATVRFDILNPADMQRLTYKTGASSVDLIGLGNANTSQITFDSGAGNYTLDFSGALTKDLNVKINSGLSQVTVIVPKNTHTIVNLDGGLSNVDTEGTWTVSNSRYETGGSGSTITIDVEMAVGNLVLQQK